MAYAYPGVYIKEFEPAPPIQGIGTSTAAFLGAAKSGPLVSAVEITSWDGFKATFGDQPVDGRYLWYAVKGFFENGGTTCYVVRISNAALASRTFTDIGGFNAIDVTALVPGTAGDGITVMMAAEHAITGNVYYHEANVANVVGGDVQVGTNDEALGFRPGDVVVLASDPTKRAIVVTIGTGPTPIVRINTHLTPAAGGGDKLQLATISHADGDTVFRLENLAGTASELAAGSVLEFTQTPTPVWDGTVASVTQERAMLSGGPKITYRVTLTAPVTSDINFPPGVNPANIQSHEFSLSLNGTAEVFHNLAMNPVSPNFYVNRVNAGPNASALVTVQPHSPPSTSLPPRNLPDPAQFGGGALNLQNGQDENLSTIGPADYQNGLDTLVAHKDVNMVAIPDSQDLAVQGLLHDHCDKLMDRIAILDSILGAGITGIGSVSEQEGTVQSANGYSAIYYPWLLVDHAPPPQGAPSGPPLPSLLVPPSGHIAGIYARTDFERGVHKAPAGEKADVRGVVGLERIVGDTDQGILNLGYGVNVIRSFRPHGRPVVWGARTTAVGLDANWQYVNVRRLFLYLEGSIQQGIRFAVFEPNTEALWASLTQSLTAFLTGVWRDGALFGSSPDKAFYVRIDKVLNPVTEQQLGRLWIEIGVRPAYPAEFIVVRIGIWLGGSTVSEG